MTTIYPLSQLGWSTFFQQQLSLDECSDYFPARVVAQHRSRLAILCETGEHSLNIHPKMPILTVGDWLLLDRQNDFYRALDRQTLFSRKAPGSKVAEQLIAANVDTVLISVALNNDFSLNRIERYLALVKAAGANALVVLTKADLCLSPDDYLQQVQALDPLLIVEVVNALEPESLKKLAPWCMQGNTIALLGSSGVGKSTIVNSLLHSDTQITSSARAADDKGRHTTTGRSLHLLDAGGLILDTPGMREIQLVDCEAGLEAAFSDVERLAMNCRYSDCQHNNEPDCAVQLALSQGLIDQRRLNNYLKLSREQERNSATLAEKRSKERSQSRYYRSVQEGSRQRKKGLK